MNAKTISNYSRLKTLLFLLPVLLLITIAVFLYSYDALSVDGYIQIQKDCFYFLNQRLGQYPGLQLNLTQLGHALVLLSFLSIFLIYVPKIWESIIPGLLVSFIFSATLKPIFAIPRPAAVFDTNSFIIIGRTLRGHSSLPSGHSITVFTVLTVLLYAFMPANLKRKIIWSFFMIITGLILVFTRIGVGAHYPMDVIAGAIIGYISGLAGIFINRNYKICTWVNNKKCYPIFILFFLVCCVVLISKIMNENLVIFYLSFASLAVSLYKTTKAYVKK